MLTQICSLAAGNISASRKRQRAQDTADDSSNSKMPATHEAAVNSEKSEENSQTSGGSGDADMPGHASTSLVSPDVCDVSIFSLQVSS